MARKKHLINVHTSTGTTAPSGASLYLGEIAVQHTSGSPALWIKVGSAESSTDYEKFIGETEINNEFHKTNHNIPFVEQSGNVYTGTTSAYTAECNELDELVDGQSIIFFTKQGSKSGTSGTILSSCTLDLTLADGTKTGPKIMYLEKNAKITTHIEGANCIRLTYRENATWSGVTGLSGWWTDYFYDANSDVRAHNLYFANAQRAVTGNSLGRYRLILSSPDENYWVPINTTTATSATAGKIITSEPIDPYGPIAYYSTTTVIAAGAYPAASSVNTKISAVTVGYSYVVTLTERQPVFLKCTPQADGSAIIDPTTPFVQSLPNTEDGKIYIFLGVAASATVFELYENKPVYEYKNGHIRIYQEGSNILGPSYTYSGLPYVNSSTTIADAYSALTKEMIDDERVTAAALNELNDRINELPTATDLAELSASVVTNIESIENLSGRVNANELVTAAALNDLNDRVNVLSASSGDFDEIYEAIQYDEEVIAASLNELNERVSTVETRMTGDYIPLTGYILASGSTENELKLTEDDTVNEAFGKLQKQMLDNEEAIAGGLNDLNERVIENTKQIEINTQAIAENTGVTVLSATVQSFSAGTYYELDRLDYELNILNSAFASYSSTTVGQIDTLSGSLQTLSGAVKSLSAKTSGILTLNLNGVEQGKYCPSASTTINFDAVQDVTGADVLLTGYELSSGSTEQELAIIATDTVNEAFGKIQKQNYDNEAVIAGALNDINADLQVLSGAIIDDELVIATALNDLNDRLNNIEPGYIRIPDFTSADEGKVLMVSGGTLVWVTPQW